MAPRLKIGELRPARNRMAADDASSAAVRRKARAAPAGGAPSTRTGGRRGAPRPPSGYRTARTRARSAGGGERDPQVPRAEECELAPERRARSARSRRLAEPARGRRRGRCRGDERFRRQSSSRKAGRRSRRAPRRPGSEQREREVGEQDAPFRSSLTAALSRMAGFTRPTSTEPAWRPSCAELEQAMLAQCAARRASSRPRFIWISVNCSRSRRDTSRSRPLVISSARHGSSASTDALRGPKSNSATSPKQSPGRAGAARRRRRRAACRSRRCPARASRSTRRARPRGRTSGPRRPRSRAPWRAGTQPSRRWSRRTARSAGGAETRASGAVTRRRYDGLSCLPWPPSRSSVRCRASSSRSVCGSTTSTGATRRADARARARRPRSRALVGLGGARAAARLACGRARSARPRRQRVGGRQPLPDGRVRDRPRAAAPSDRTLPGHVGRALARLVDLRELRGVHPERVAKFVAIEGIEPPPACAMARADDARRAPARRDRARRRAGRPFSAPLRDARGRGEAHARGERVPLAGAGAPSHRHGVARNEDGTFSWKFDNYARADARRPPTTSSASAAQRALPGAARSRHRERRATRPRRVRRTSRMRAPWRSKAPGTGCTTIVSRRRCASCAASSPRREMEAR